ncbi:hypothetical protein ES703_15535 [subsurface metagenome]
MIKKSLDASVFETIAVTDPKVTIVDNVVTINPDNTFGSLTGYYVNIGINCFKDIAGNYYGGISDWTTWNFTSRGQVAYYPFSGNANDESGNGNNGTVYGATLTADRFGNPNSAYDFDAIDDYIEVPDSDSLDATNEITIAAWVKPNVNDVTSPIVVKIPESGSEAYWLYGWTSGTQGPRFRIKTTTGYIGDATTTELLSETSWSFIAGTYKGSQAKLYINGELKGTDGASGTINTSSLPLRIGASHGAGIVYFDGKIDDVRIYNRGLSESEIKALYAEAAYYPFNGNAQDESGNLNHGAVTGATLTEDRFGNPNSAYSFDGVDDRIIVSDADTLDITGPITIMAWIKPTTISELYVVLKRELVYGGGVYSLDIFPGMVRSVFRYGSGAQTRIATGGTGINAGKWQHIAVTWDGYNTITVYYNGQPDGTGTFDVNADGPIQTSAGNLEIGYYSGAQPDIYFDGIIDEVRIFNRALSPAEIIATSRVSQTYEFVTEWGSYGSGDGQFDYPLGTAVDGYGNIYVADGNNSRIQKFNSSGVFLTKWGTYGAGDGQFGQVIGVAVDSSGNIYTADNTNHRIQKFNSSGDFLTNWGSEGTGDGEFNHPQQLAIDSSDNVYVTDYGNHRIKKFTSSGVFLTKWGSEGTGDGEFDYPWGVAVDSSACVYVTDYQNNRIQKFTSSGVFLTKWGSGGTLDGQFDLPRGIAVDSSGYVYVIDTYNYRVQKFRKIG